MASKGIASNGQPKDPRLSGSKRNRDEFESDLPGFEPKRDKSEAKFTVATSTAGILQFKRKEKPQPAPNNSNTVNNNAGSSSSSSSRPGSSVSSSSGSNASSVTPSQAPRRMSDVQQGNGKDAKVERKTERKSESSQSSFFAPNPLSLGRPYRNESYENTLINFLEVTKSPLIKALDSKEKSNLAQVIMKHFNVDLGNVSDQANEWFIESNDAVACGEQYMDIMTTDYFPVPFKCHSIVLTQIKGENIAYVAVSGRHKEAWDEAKYVVDLLNKEKRGNCRWSLVEQRGENSLEDLDKLVSDILEMFELNHDNHGKVCAEKSYLAMMLKLLVKFGSDMTIHGVANCLTLEKPLEGYLYKFIPCCDEGCTPNKLAAILLCAYAKKLGQDAAGGKTPDFLSPHIKNSVYVPAKAPLTPFELPRAVAR